MPPPSSHAPNIMETMDTMNAVTAMSPMTPISIDEEARDTLDRYFYDHPLSAIRIYITTRSSKGPKLALRPDIQTDKDLTFEAEEYTFLINPHLAHQLGHIRIAAYDMGFQVIAENPLGHSHAPSAA